MAPKKYRQKVKQQKQSQATPHETHHHHKKGKDRRSLYLSIVAVAIVVIVIGAIAASGLTGNNGGSSNPTASPSPSTSPTADDPYVNSTYVFFHTSMGNFTVQLRNDMPLTTGNFLKLVQDGVYDGSTFHRVIENFMVQGGIPGNGQSVSTIQDEFTSTNHNYNGTIAMAKSGNTDGSAIPNTATSQFFINTANNNLGSAGDGTPFDNNYVAFGKVIYGMENVMAISHVNTNSNDAPLQTITIISASVLNT